MADYIKVIHEKVMNNIEENNLMYKAVANQHRRRVEFEEKDVVWAVLANNRFPTGAYNKLKDHKVGLCKILKKINDIAYQLQLSHVKTANVFNVKHLSP
ncbi:hypothetical protein ACLB2K_067003 [Fragaria x ananassa]